MRAIVVKVEVKLDLEIFGTLRHAAAAGIWGKCPTPVPERNQEQQRVRPGSIVPSTFWTWNLDWSMLAVQ